MVAILAGGLAMRLRPSGYTGPKALIQVAGRPFLFHLLDLLRMQEVRRLVICVGHLGDQIVSAIGRGREFGVSVDYSFDGELLLGTGGALKKAAPLLGEDFMVLNGDTYLNCDYSAAYAAFVASGKNGLMCVYRNENRGEPSNVVFSNGRNSPTIRRTTQRT